MAGSSGPGMHYTRNKGSVGGGSYRDMARDLQNIVEEELTEAGKEGLKEAEAVMDAAATGKNWTKGPTSMQLNSPWGESGTGDRNATGKMRDALDYRIIRGKSVGLDVGWPRIWEDYFGYQDTGFDATGMRNGRDAVQGMGIIAHLRTSMRDSVDTALDRSMKRISDGL